MISLTVSSLAWLKGPDDDPSDLCAHGRVSFCVNATTFVKPDDGVWTVSTAALYLLRTLSSDHTPSNSVADYNFLFPDCGFSVWPNNGKYKVICIGCNQGIDVQVTHDREKVILRSTAGTETISFAEWQSALCGFAKQVLSFYQQCNPKRVSYDNLERRGWQSFWSEWEERAVLPIKNYLHHGTGNVIRTQHLDLIAATVSHLEAELESPARLGDMLGVKVPSAWPPGEYDQGAIEFFRDCLVKDPKATGWYSWYAVFRATGGQRDTLIGAGGFFGPPTAEGVVEIGYSVVPEFRLRGLGTELVGGLVDRAFYTSRVTRILAHTNPSNLASIRVLERCEFSLVGPGREPGTIQYTYLFS